MMVPQSPTAYSSLPTEEDGGGASVSPVYRDGPPPPFRRGPPHPPSPRRERCVKAVTVMILVTSALGIAMTVAIAVDPKILERMGAVDRVDPPTASNIQEEYYSQHFTVPPVTVSRQVLH